jgi:large subunit ribosomal protein L2
MGLRKFKPVTPGTRFRVGADFSEITTRTPEKTLIVKSNKSGGRNNTGKMTMRYIGGGHKQLYRLIDFKRDKKDISSLQKDYK